MEYYSAIKKKEILPFVTTWMDLEGIMLSEMGRKEKDKYHMISLICRVGGGKPNSQIQRADWWLPEVQGEGMAELDEGG